MAAMAAYTQDLGYEPRTLAFDRDTGHRVELPASSCGYSSQPLKENIKNNRETRRPRAPSLASVKAAITLGGPLPFNCGPQKRVKRPTRIFKLSQGAPTNCVNFFCRLLAA